MGLCIAGLVWPLHHKVGQADFELVVCRFIAGQSAHDNGRILGPKPGHAIPHPLVELRCSHPRGQSEKEAIDLARLKQLHKPPQRGFGFTAAGFGLQYDDGA